MSERSVIVHASTLAFALVASLVNAGTAKADPVTAKGRDLDEVLSTCHVDAKTKRCEVTPEDAEEICRAMTPTAALRVFIGKKKLRQGYLTRDMEVWSTTRAHATKSRARFDEEVIVLSQRRAKSSVVVSGGAVTYEVLRWDGTCASLMGDEITFKRAPTPVRPVELDRLYLPVQTKLLDDATIHAAVDRASAACREDAKTVACDVAKRRFGATLVARGARLAL